MVYVVIFDFALAGLTLAIFGFFVWYWIAFSKKRLRHPFSERCEITVSHTKTSTLTTKRCA